MPSESRDKRPSDSGKAAVKEVKKEKAAGPMDRWVEPALATKASFEDHNGVPYGVMEHMQPLGEAPNGKVRARVKAEATRKSVAGRSAATAQATPEGTPQPPTQTQTRQQVKTEPSSRPASTVPIKNEGKKEAERAPAPAAAAAKTKKKDPARKPPVVPTHSAPKNKWNKPGTDVLLRPEDCTDTKIAEVIVEAKERATAAGNPELADAVQEVYNESQTSTRLKNVLIKVLSQTASQEDMEEFQTFVKAAKRRIAARKGAASRKAGEDAARKLPKLPKLPKFPVNGTSTRVSQPASSKTTSTQNSSSKSQQPAKAATAPKAQQKSAPVPKAQPSSSARTPAPRTAPSTTPRSRSKKMNDDSETSELTDLDEDDEVVVLDAPPAKPTRTSTSKARVSAYDEQTSDTQPAKAAAKRPLSATEAGASDSNPKERAAARKSREASRASLAVPQTNLKRSSEEAELDKGTTPDPELQAKKLKLSTKVQRDQQWEESNVRTLREPPNRQTRVSTRVNGVSGSARQTRQADRDLALEDYSDLGSPLSSPSGSHRHTPPPVTLKARSGKRAKTKQSPEKKSTHASNTQSGATGSHSPMDIDDSDAEASENNDYCSNCQGSGHLLCCDGCEKSFHFMCTDPPLPEDADELNEPYFCNACVAKKRAMGEGQAEKPRFGLFAPLVVNLAKRNPTIFSLPADIQNHYEGVGADNEGNFINVPRPGKKKAGFGDPVDLYKLRDAKGNVLFCYSCQQTSHGTRQVVQCDECSQVWHLDCLDPPLAIHPCITGDGRKVADWLCPLHIEHEMRQVEAKRLFNQRQSRKLHIRKPRGAKVVETFLTRGATNNGFIEVNNIESSDDDSESEFFLDEDPRREDVILKIPDTGIKLDFIAKIKQNRVQHYRDRHFDQQVFGKAQGSRVQMVTARRLPSSTTTALAHHNVREQQTALNLAQFAHASTNEDLGLGGNNVETLIAGLLAELPPQVLSRMDPAESQKGLLKTWEREELLALQKLIARRLETLKA